MDDRYKVRLAEILISTHRDELIISMMKDLYMFSNQDRFINSVIKDNTIESEMKVKIISKFINLN